MAADFPSAGSIIGGKYRLERVLGQGGMGIVFAARHLELGERVAIKFPVSTRASASPRLLREARATMRIRSEHVARVFDLGSLSSGNPYLVMEYLVGRDLAAVLASDGRLEPVTAVDYVLQALEAIAEAHVRGIIHRDLKPSNLFLTRRVDGSPLIKVIDFGISKWREGATETGLTTGLGMIGTPLYMAPEQMRRTQPVDGRADIWALGATLFALVAGKAPFSGISQVEVYEKILQGTPGLADLCPAAPPSLEAVVRRCLHPNPEGRYADAGELAAALRDFSSPAALVSVERVARIVEAGLPAELCTGKRWTREEPKRKECSDSR